MGCQPWEIHTIPPNLVAELFPGLTYEEAVADQENLYEALTIIASDHESMTSGNERGPQQGQQSQLWDESYLSANDDIDSQLASDEAIARSLQELEDGIHTVSVSDATHGNTRNEENTSQNVSANASANSSTNSSANAAGSSSTMGLNEDDALPETEMTYEEMLSLGDAIGTQSRGLSQNDIDSLPSFNYKKGLFSKKGKAGQCAICLSEYQHKQRLTILPCAHQYHAKCITRWLKENKKCPICKLEVNLSS